MRRSIAKLASWLRASVLRAPNAIDRQVYSRSYFPRTSKKPAWVDRYSQDAHVSETKFRLLVDSVKEYAIYLLDHEGRVTSWNKGAERILGYTTEEAIGLNVSAFHCESDREANAAKETLRIARLEGKFEAQVRRMRKDGSLFWANVVIDPIYDKDCEIVGFAKVVRDVSDVKAAEDKLLHLALRDQLTGLLNRTSLLNDLQILKSKRLKNGVCSVAIAILDIDKFRQVNDSYGQVIGDRLLTEAGRRLVISAPNCKAYRLGGDRFVLLSSVAGEAGAENVAVKASSSIAMPFLINGHTIRVKTTVGIAATRDFDEGVEDLIANAELALAHARASSEVKQVVFDSAMRARIRAQEQVEVDLKIAHEKKQFVLYYQPQVRLSDGLVIGAEALLRWKHPARGLILPSAFIDTLVRSPVALELGEWILNQACQAATRWGVHSSNAIKVSVNLFPSQYHSRTLTEEVSSVLQNNNCMPSTLVLEITENIALREDQDVVGRLKNLRNLGVSFAFDDFGTGYASLSCLNKYPISTIKIDKSFVMKCGEVGETADKAIVRSIIALGHSLKLKIIAEGVETVDQAVFLRRQGCQEAQGFLYGKPMPEQDFVKYLLANKSSCEMSV